MGKVAQKTRTVHFIKDKETKNTVRFAAPDGAPSGISGSIYVPKDSPLAKESSLFVDILTPTD